VTLGLLGSYNWLVGRQQRLVLRRRRGLKRVLKDVKATRPSSRSTPDGRLLIGFAF
jgi:hypothetical protein